MNSYPHYAATAPSTTLWSLLNVTFITWTTLNYVDPSFTSSSTTTVFVADPTAKIQTYGGFTIAVKLLTPNMPKFETVNVPPDNSSGLSLFSLALPAMSLTSVAIYSRPFKLTLETTGAIKPWSVWTAKAMLTFLNCLMKSWLH